MCMLMTLAAALAITGLWLREKKRNLRAKSRFTAELMFWAAALMWSVDGIAAVCNNEAFFDLSAADALLGGIILACGLTVFAFLSVRERTAVRKAA